jgi:hypothetical protein
MFFGVSFFEKKWSLLGTLSLKGLAYWGKKKK